MSAHQVIMETPGRLGGTANLVIATTTLMFWTPSRVMLSQASACAACITVRALPARTASWVTMATLCSRTAGVSSLLGSGVTSLKPLQKQLLNQ